MEQMGNKKKSILSLVFAAIVGSFIGEALIYALFNSSMPQQAHVCQCERCKLIRQLETVEVLDSVIRDRIVININKEE